MPTEDCRHPLDLLVIDDVRGMDTPARTWRAHRHEEAHKARKLFDCREWPDECMLAISGEQKEVVEAQLLHAVHAHGQKESPQLREQIRASLKDAPAGG